MAGIDDVRRALNTLLEWAEENSLGSLSLKLGKSDFEGDGKDIKLEVEAGGLSTIIPFRKERR